jgi:sugar-specific transcriptional regulator TrmB
MARTAEREGTDILMELGCSLSEARVYLALVQIGASQVGAISKATSIHRENIYKIVHALEQKNIVIREIGSTIRYRAVPPEEALPMLLKLREQRVTELKAKSAAIVEKLKLKPSLNEALEEANAQFTLIPAKEIIIQRLRQALQKAQINVDTITTQKRFSQAVLEFGKDYKNALDRGVTIRIGIEQPITEKTAVKALQTLLGHPNFKIKYFSGSPEAIVGTFDKKEAHISISTTTHLEGSAGLWSNNSSFVALSQSYFENIWNNAQEQTPKAPA